MNFCKFVQVVVTLIYEVVGESVKTLLNARV